MNVSFIFTESGHQHTIGMRTESTLIGNAEYHLTGDILQIIDIAITEGFRRKGYGTQLLAKIIDEAKRHACTKIWLEVRSKNSAAISLYKKSGFVQQGLRKGYYQNDGDDALLFDRAI